MTKSIGTPESNPRFSRPEAAHYVGISVATLASWVSRGGGPPFVRAWAKVIYFERDLDAWLASRRVRP